MKIDEKTGLPLVGIPKATTMLPLLETVGDARAWEAAQASMAIAELRKSAGEDPGTIKFRRSVPFKVVK